MTTSNDSNVDHIAPSAAPPWKADVATVIAITVIATAATSLLHEGLGHGGMCVAVGGTPKALTSTYFGCDVHDSHWRLILLAAGGSIMNLVAALAAFLLLRSKRGVAPRWRFLFWLLLTFNLLNPFGYLVFSGVANLGDFAVMIDGRSPAILFHAALVILGVPLYLLAIRVVTREMAPFLGHGSDRSRQAKILAFVPYFANGLASCAAGALNPQGWMIVAISAAAATFGGASGLTMVPSLVEKKWVPDPGGNQSIERSIPWIALGALILGAFIGLFGPGIRFH